MNIKRLIKYKYIDGYLLLTLFYLMLSTPGVWKYVGVLVIAGVLMSIKRIVIEKRNLFIALPICVYVICGSFLLARDDISFLYFIKQIVFFCTPLFGALVLAGYIKNGDRYSSERFLDIQMFALTTVFIIRQAPDFTFYNLLESHYAFTLGVYALYYLYIKKYLYFLFALFFMFLGHKRMAFFALAFSWMLFLVRYFSSKKQKMLLTCLSLWEIIILYGYLFFCYEPGFIEIRMKLDRFFSGRMKAWEQIHDLYSFHPCYIGKGIGWVLGSLDGLKIAHFDNLHNDVLSIYIELGFIGFGLWVCLTFLVLIYAEKKYRLCIFVLLTYTMIVMCTDNISIYIGYLMPYYMMLLLLLGSKRPVGRTDG